MKIVLKDAYYAVLIHQDSRKHLYFLSQGTTFKFRCLWFGLLLASPVFSRILRPFEVKLRSEGVQTVIYLNDLLLIHHQKEALLEIFHYVLKATVQPGFCGQAQEVFNSPHSSVHFPWYSILHKSDVYCSAREAF